MVWLVVQVQQKEVSEAIQAGIAAGNINIHTSGRCVNLAEALQLADVPPSSPLSNLERC